LCTTELPPEGDEGAIAQQRAKESLGLDLEGARIFVIGDTPADIACGRELGARAIAVARKSASKSTR